MYHPFRANNIWSYLLQIYFLGFFCCCCFSLYGVVITSTGSSCSIIIWSLLVQGQVTNNLKMIDILSGCVLILHFDYVYFYPWQHMVLSSWCFCMFLHKQHLCVNLFILFFIHFNVCKIYSCWHVQLFVGTMQVQGNTVKAIKMNELVYINSTASDKIRKMCRDVQFTYLLNLAARQD